jgi:hypothetical protein
MLWVVTLASEGSEDSGLVFDRTGQYRESPVGSPDCMILWPAGPSSGCSWRPRSG